MTDKDYYKKLNAFRDFLNSKGYDIDVNDDLWMEDCISDEHKFKDIFDLFEAWDTRPNPYKMIAEGLMEEKLFAEIGRYVFQTKSYNEEKAGWVEGFITGWKSLLEVCKESE